MSLIHLPAESWPATNGWLVPGWNCTALQYAIVTRSACDDGIREVPPASNRGVRLDRYTKRAGSPLGSWWCAIWAGCVYADCGALVPAGFPATDAWLPYLRPVPCIGAAILYGVKGDAHHIGIVTRLPKDDHGADGIYRGGAKVALDAMLTREGNRAYAGTTNNGVAVDQAPPRRADILGYFYPTTGVTP